LARAVLRALRFAGRAVWRDYRPSARVVARVVAKLVTDGARRVIARGRLGGSVRGERANRPIRMCMSVTARTSGIYSRRLASAHDTADTRPDCPSKPGKSTIQQGRANRARTRSRPTLPASVRLQRRRTSKRKYTKLDEAHRKRCL